MLRPLTMLSAGKPHFYLILIFLLISMVGVRAQKNVVRKAFIRHTVQRGETFESIGNLYNVSSEKLSSFNYIEDYDGPVIALYLNVPLTVENFSRSAATSQLKNLVPVYHVNGKNEHLVVVSKDSHNNVSQYSWSNPALGTKSLNSTFIDGYLAISPEAKAMFKTDTSASILRQNLQKRSEPGTPVNAITNAIVAAVPTIDIALDNGKPLDTLSIMSALIVDTASKPVQVKSITKPIVQRVTGRNKRVIRASTSQKLLRFISLLLIANLVIVASIHLYLFLKRRNDKKNKQSGKAISKVLIQTLLNNVSAGKTATEQPQIIPKKGNTNVTKQLIIDELLQAKLNFKGIASNNLVALYSELKLDEFSLKKLRHKSWSVVTSGIKELATMEQANRLTEISSLLDHTNDEVRIEAQCAVVKLTGYDGLRFLDNLKYPLPEWHQIRLINQLSTNEPIESIELFRWLYSANDTIVTLLLKTIAYAKFLNMYQWVTVLLKHPAENVRLEAIKCIREIANSDTPAFLQDAYASQALSARLLILKVLGEIGCKDQQSFFLHQLGNHDDSIKLAAAYALVNCIDNGFDLLDDYCFNKGTPYSQIISHIKDRVQA